jgi:hypothetical protein
MMNGQPDGLDYNGNTACKIALFTLRRLFYFSYKYVQKWFKELYFFCLILNIQLMSEFLIEAISQNSRLHKYTLK